MATNYHKFSIVEFATQPTSTNPSILLYNPNNINNINNIFNTCNNNPRRRGRPCTKNLNPDSVRMMITKTEPFNRTSYTTSNFTHSTPEMVGERMKNRITKRRRMISGAPNRTALTNRVSFNSFQNVESHTSEIPHVDRNVMYVLKTNSSPSSPLSESSKTTSSISQDSYTLTPSTKPRIFRTSISIKELLN